MIITMVRTVCGWRGQYCSWCSTVCSTAPAPPSSGTSSVLTSASVLVCSPILTSSTAIISNVLIDAFKTFTQRKDCLHTRFLLYSIESNVHWCQNGLTLSLTITNDCSLKHWLSFLTFGYLSLAFLGVTEPYWALLGLTGPYCSLLGVILHLLTNWLTV